MGNQYKCPGAFNFPFELTFILLFAYVTLVLFSMDIADQENYRSKHEKRQISRQRVHIPQPYGNSQEQTRKQSAIKLHSTSPPDIAS